MNARVLMRELLLEGKAFGVEKAQKQVLALVQNLKQPIYYYKVAIIL